ncbi:hypothetical protein Tco_1156001 [Tanacetum coccineum]
MDLYHSRLTPIDLNDLIIKYKISRDLHPRLPLEDFVMSELSNDAIGPLGLNKVITFKVLCRSLQIVPTRTLFRVFQTLCKQGDWFLFSKRRAPSLVCIDDNRSCMKHWKNSAHVIKLKDMPEGVLVLSTLSRVWKSRVCDPVLWGADVNVMGIYDFLCLPEWTGAKVQEEPHLDVRLTLQRLPFYCTPHAVAKDVIPDPTLEDLVIDDDESNDDDDDACVEIPLVIPLCSAAVIPSSRNQGRSSIAPTSEGSNTRDSRGKCIMVDDVAAPSSGVSRPRPSSRPAPSFKDVSSDAIHIDFFPFSAGPYYATYPEGGVARNCDVLHYVMMSHGGELLTRYHGLNQSHHEYVLSADSRLKGYEEKVANMTGLKLQSKAKGKERKKKIKSLGKSLDNLHAEVACLSATLNQVTILEAERAEEILRLKATHLDSGELLSLAASAGFERGFSMHQTEDESAMVLKKMANFMPGAHDRLAEASPLGTCASPPIAKESTVTPVSESLKLSANVNFTSSAITSKHNEEIVNDEGISVDLDGVTELVEVVSRRVPSGPNDVVVALSAYDKGDGLDSSSASSKEATVNPLWGLDLVLPFSLFLCVVVHLVDPESCHLPRPNSFPLGTCSIAGQASVGLMS